MPKSNLPMTAIADEEPQFGVFRNGRRLAVFGNERAAQAQAVTLRGEVREIDKSDLRPELVGLEGCRIEATDAEGNRYRFIVGRSTGWKPIHLEIKRSNSLGGMACRSTGYTNVRVIERVR